ncbi:MAG: DEDD exonuclease domain-containing protein [Chlorobi bacterium]|nr:MAG: DNA polymerase III subunit epsilon [Chlorobi bacterium OLB7]MBK8910155.1 DEDD exonuclease domain-containing protein [Chlorobiota bacterium]MBX7217665.1 DEDD exonuclease domain-containing protein [Candidatus Kapabacteria bacterium]
MQQLLSHTQCIVTDIETTGLSPERNRITEVACVGLLDGELTERRRTLVNPEQFIPQNIQQMTGITNAMVLAAPKGELAFPEIRSWFPSGAAFVAHNAQFDYNFLQAAFRRHALPPLAVTPLCTMRLAKRLLPKRKGYSLGNLAGYFGIKIRGRHTALGDAEATARLLAELLDILQEEHGCETIEEALAFQRRTIGAFREQPRHFGGLEPSIAALPALPGVYRMLDRSGEILYIGKAKNLRERVGSYFRPSAEHTKKIQEMVKRVRGIEARQTGSELEALLLEARLIKEELPPYNTALKRFRRHAFLRIDRAEAFPRVELATAMHADGAEYFGPFRNRESAEAVMDTITRLFRLRLCDEMPTPNTAVRPCFYHQIARCGAPCALRQTQQQYLHEVERVRQFLSGAENGILRRMEQAMEQSAQELKFEEAALLRDRLAEFQRIFSSGERVADSINANNMLALLPAEESGKQHLFFIRHGRLAGRVLVGNRLPEAALRKQLSRLYFAAEPIPLQLGRIEIEEVRIVASYLFQQRESGAFIRIAEGEGADDVLQKLAAIR